MDFWRHVYHLSGLTLLDMTKEEPLGSLPAPLRTTALALAERLLPDSVQVDWVGDRGPDAASRYPRGWRWLSTAAAEPHHLAPQPPTPPPTLHEYFARHNLLPQDERHDEHFAERLFVERVFVPVFGLEALDRLQPQVTFRDASGKERAIDFVLDNDGGRRYAVEIEGRTYHQAPDASAQFQQEKFRQRALVLADYLYLPIAYSEIEQGDAAQARAALLHLVESDEALHDTLHAIGPGNTPPEQQKAALRLLFETLPVRFPFYQAHVIDTLAAAAAGGEPQLHLVEAPEDGPLLLLALFDTLALIERTAQLYGLTVTLPAITLHICAPGASNAASAGIRAALAAEYLCAPLARCGEQADGRRDRALQTIRIQTDTVEAEMGSRRAPVEDALPALRRRFGAEFPDLAPVATANVQTLAPVLNFFARRYFPLEELKPEQIQLLRQALAAQSGIGILPTGFGKSLVFQLYALLTPGTTLVISPLKSLIHDQLLSMRRIGLGCVHAISSSDANPFRRWTLQQLASHRIRLLYVSPERLRIKSFYTEMFPTARRTPMCALFIDEVHCISEWGHDFRPAYLAIGELVHKLSEARGSHVPVIGLTATASRDVRADILEVLHLAATDVVQLSTSDRANLSLSVHPVDEGMGAKTAVIAGLLRTTLPATLEIAPEELRAHNSGVLFGMYANAHGSTMISEGVHQIAQDVSTALGLPAGAAGIHASRAPSLCPSCGSATYLSRSIKTATRTASAAGDNSAPRGRQNWCPACQTTFDRPQLVDKETWQERLESTQDGFYRGDFPLMVATKSYGMGIDKQDIRYIIHHAVAGGMESYYQEAGRAGRDGRAAHVALVCKLPVRQCYEEHLLREAAPPCVTDKVNLRFWKCPYSPAGLCDAGHQARFIAQSYPGVEQDATEVVALYQKLRDLKGADLQIRTTRESDGEANGEKQADLALFRLQQLGLIHHYTKEYQGDDFLRYCIKRAEHWTAQTVAAHLAVHLAHSGLGPEAVAATLAPLQETALWATGKKDQASRFVFLKAAVAVLLQRVYDRVPRMRYTMLSSLLRYAFNDQGRCRRLYIRTYFDAQPPDDNYRCEFCDACHPDLRFDRQEAVIPAADRQLAHLTAQLPAILATFVPADLRQVITTAEAKIAIVSLFEKINRVLEDDATNVAALFLTGALARRQPSLAALALERLRFAFVEGERRGFSLEQLGEILAEAQALDAAAALAWIDRRGGPFDNPAGLAALEEATANLHGPDSPQARTVRNLRRVRTCRTLQADVATVAERLGQLHAKLSRSLQQTASPQPPSAST